MTAINSLDKLFSISYDLLKYDEEVVMKEEEVIETLKKDNEEFRQLYQEHKELDSQLLEFNKKAYLTVEEEAAMHRIKKEKLYKKDKIAEIIREYKKRHSGFVL